MGDSRAYRIDAEEIEQLTKDHSLVQALYDEGKITEEQKRSHPRKNVITRALGSDEQVRADLFEYKIKPGSRYLVCSDGLYDLVDEKTIHEIIIHNTLEKAVELLITKANDNGGNDNITVIIFAP